MYELKRGFKLPTKDGRIYSNATVVEDCQEIPLEESLRDSISLKVEVLGRYGHED